jgi:integrase
VSKRANGQGSVRKRGGAWWVRVSVRGKRVEIKTTAETRTEALAALNQKLTERAAGTLDPDAQHTRVADLFADLRRDYEINQKRAEDLDVRWKHLAPVFANDLARSITTPRLRRYVEERLAEGAARATVQRELAALRRAFRLGEQAEKVVRVPHFPSIRVENARQGFFEEADFRRVVSHLPEPLRVLAVVGFWTGWRKGDLLRLERRRHVDLDARTLQLFPGETKNKDGRRVHLPPEALGVLRAWEARTAALEREKSVIIRHLFHRDGKPIRNYYAAWHSACAKAGVPGRMFHDFRRTAARNYIRSGVHEGTVMAILGHRTRSIFDRYNIISEDDLRAASEVVQASVGTALGQHHPDAQVLGRRR